MQAKRLAVEYRRSVSLLVQQQNLGAVLLIPAVFRLPESEGRIINPLPLADRVSDGCSADDLLYAVPRLVYLIQSLRATQKQPLGQLAQAVSSIEFGVFVHGENQALLLNHLPVLAVCTIKSQVAFFRFGREIIEIAQPTPIPGVSSFQRLPYLPQR